MPSRRFPWVLATVLGLAGTVALPPLGWAKDDPPAAPKPKESDAQADETAAVIQLPTDLKQKKKLAAARDYMNEQSWQEVCRILQSLLDAPEDTFVGTQSKDAAGRPVTTWLSVRSEANRLLANLPPPGREKYELLYGPTAAELLKEGRAKKDADRYAEVVRRYLHTRAGVEALGLVASHHAAAGSHARAADSFGRLLQCQEPKEWTTQMLFDATRAFRRVDEYEQAEATWKAFRDRAEQGKVRVGDRTQTLAEWQTELNKVAPPPAADPKDWPVYRRDPGRSNHGAGDKPFLEKTWGFGTIKEEQTRILVEAAVKRSESRGQPVLPAFFPVAADGKVVYRDYWGLQAHDLKTGQAVWESDSRYSLDRLLDPREAGSRSPLANAWARAYLDQMGRPGMLFENSVVGTLSTDGARVYAVEDLYVPPPTNGMIMNGPVVMNYQYQQYGELRKAVFANQLDAYSLRNGKLLWELSAQPDKEEGKEGEVAKQPGEAYFLGPPLPVDGKLYVLTQRNQDLRLLCLDPERGAVQWSQLLATTQGRLSQEVTRRTWAAHLAYGEGVLVCPTNAGMLLGVDVLSHTVVWAHPYREKGQNPANQQPGGPMIMRGGVPAVTVTAPEWKVTAPIVQDGRVVFTAPDSVSVRCVNVRDGKLVWRAPRTDDDLYLAGIVRGKVLIVGKKECRALGFTDGSTVWQVPTGVPSGQGVATDRRYYLPLKEGPTHEPEVCVLDVDTGRIVSHARSRKHEVPGNLLLYDGDVVSQTVEEVAAFPQLEARRSQMNERIARNPNDPVGLAERGELSLDDGNLPDAINDLRAALKNSPPPAIQARARAQLYDALTDYLRDNFRAGEKYLAEYRELCRVEAGPDASPEERKRAEAETARRLSNYLALLGRGREQQGKLAEALRAYLDFAAPGSRHDLIAAPDEPAVKVAAEVWTHGRIAAMTARATPEQRQAITDEIGRRWQAVREADDPGLRTFVRVFGSLGPRGLEARRLLAERLADDGIFLEAERQFLILREQRDDLPTAARATEALARLSVARGLFEDALFWYRALAHDFPGVVVHDGKTGADSLKDLATDKRFLPFLEEPVRHWSRVRVSMQTETGQFTPLRMPFRFEPEGPVLPFFRRYQVALDQHTNEFQLIDREKNEVTWQAKVNAAPFLNFLMQQGQVPNGQPPRYSYRTVGHVIVLPVGHTVFGIDPLGHKVLWERSLLGAAGLPAGTAPTQVIQDPKDGGVEVVYPDGWHQRLGQPGPAEPAYVCLLTRDGLRAIDPISGDVLWERADVRPRSHVFGDDRHVYLVDLRDGGPPSTRVFRAADGASVTGVPEFGSIFQHRQRLDGSHILAAEPRAGKTLVRLYDIPSGKDLWHKECPTASLMLSCEEPHQGGVVQPDGTVIVLDLQSGREIVTTHIEPQDIERAQGASLVQDDAQYYLAINGPRDGNLAWAGSAFQAGAGPRCVPVNGKIYAFDRETGKVNWESLPISSPPEMLVVDQFRELPFLLLASRYNRMVNNGRFGFVGNGQGAALTVLDKRTGKYLKDDHALPNAQQQPFHTFRADLREGKIVLTSMNLKITLTLQEAKAPPP
jgi:outer membrane protein assembly factor BamB